MWKKNDILINKISVPSVFILEKSYLIKPSMIELPKVIRVSPLDFLTTTHKNITEEVDEINKILTSDPEGITIFHYMDQPKSMLCGKLVKQFIGEILEILIINGYQNVL